MRFLVDESTGVAVVKHLRAAGHDVISVAEEMFQAEDAEVLARAVAEDCILISNDKDFGDLVFRGLQGHKGVILLRLKEDSTPNRIRVLEHLLDHHADRLEGSFTVATEDTVRIRPILKLL
jgi:predicted nuclease of predicted toxin-antitoxin system